MSRYSYQTRNPKAVHSPLRSVQWNRPAHAVLGQTPEQLADMAQAREAELAAVALQNAQALVTHLRLAYVRARQAIGDANRGIWRGLLHRNASAAKRRDFRSRAFQEFNASLRDLRAAERAQVAARAATCGALTPKQDERKEVNEECLVAGEGFLKSKRRPDGANRRSARPDQMAGKTRCPRLSLQQSLHPEGFLGAVASEGAGAT